MEYANDPQFLAMIFILPGLFGFALIGEGVNKVMNYDNHGWIGVGAGAVFVVVIIIAYFMMSTRTLG